MFYELENNKSDKRTSQAPRITKLIYFYKFIKNDTTVLQQRNEKLFTSLTFRGLTKNFTGRNIDITLAS